MYFFFFFNDPATPEIYTLSLHDALPICGTSLRLRRRVGILFQRGGSKTQQEDEQREPGQLFPPGPEDRKSTRLNSSHTVISYAVFCLKKKKRRDLETST